MFGSSSVKSAAKSRSSQTENNVMYSQLEEICAENAYLKKKCQYMEEKYGKLKLEFELKKEKLEKLQSNRTDNLKGELNERKSGKPSHETASRISRSHSSLDDDRLQAFLENAKT